MFLELKVNFMMRVSKISSLISITERVNVFSDDKKITNLFLLQQG